jgi:sialate O-acetylesterase
VQLAPFGSEPGQFAAIREAQMAVAKSTPNVATVATTDVGDLHDIHPKNKAPIGERLALAARALAYGEDIEFRGPTLTDAKFDSDSATLTFDHVGEGLVAKGGAPRGFLIAGSNRKFVAADAMITGANTVIVSSPEVEDPVAVRFAWADFNEADLWSGTDLPAEPFRTDQFPGVVP